MAKLIQPTDSTVLSWLSPKVEAQIDPHQINSTLVGKNNLRGLTYHAVLCCTGLASAGRTLQQNLQCKAAEGIRNKKAGNRSSTLLHNSQQWLSVSANGGCDRLPLPFIYPYPTLCLFYLL
eukprot:TRINITY_DN66400_c2_g2_i1.p1 TRINITY_DN66400_c2_g2~~TRINITY_DN66400_c2_g2_i1.p1  ORF type:complete len:121 (-),score=6.39 TRINITY_DN66400_c2_g2_i1:87-449(-)